MNAEVNVANFKNMSKETISSLTTSTIKGLLFECCALINDLQAYNRINKRSISCRNKTNNCLTEEGHIAREGTLENVDQCKRDEDEKDINNFI